MPVWRSNTAEIKLINFYSNTLVRCNINSKLSICDSGLFSIVLMQTVMINEKPIRKDGDSRCRLKSWGVRLLNTCSSHRHRFSNFHNSSIKKHTFQNERVGPISGRHSFKAKPLLPLTDRFPSNCYGLWRKHNSRLEKEKQLANRNLSSMSN